MFDGRIEPSLVANLINIYILLFSKPDGDATDGSGGLEGLPGVPGLDSDNYITVSNVNWRQGRQLLRQ